MTTELKPPPMSDDQIAAVLLPFDRDSNFDDIVRTSIAARDAQWLSLVGELQRDAERYRWLRDTSNPDDPRHMIALYISEKQADASLSGIDAAIDAARGEKGGV